MTDTQVGDQWGELERLAVAATPGDWTVSTTGGKAAFVMAPHPDVGSVGICRMDWTRGPHVAAENAAFIAAANPAIVLELIAAARSVGIGAADEPKTSQHPIRGEGEPVAWRSKLQDDDEWELCFVDPRCDTADFDVVQPLYAHPPTTYGKGEELREKVEEVADDLRVLSLELSGWRTKKISEKVFSRALALEQALQSISGRTG